jgi:hypothetical protein
LKMRKIVFIFFPEILTWIYIITNCCRWIKNIQVCGWRSNYYLDTFLAPKNLDLKVGCFTKNIYFNHSPVTIYKITGEVSHNNIVWDIWNNKKIRW